MTGPWRDPPGPGSGRFAPNPRPESDIDLGDSERADQREQRLSETLAEVEVCLRDGAELVAMGKQRFDEEWLVRRAAKNIVTEFAETTNRLPDRFKEEHPQLPWQAIKGMRNRVVHVYESADPEIIWSVLSCDFPTIRQHL